MKKKKSIFKFLIFIMMLSLFLPANVLGASDIGLDGRPGGGGKGGGGKPNDPPPTHQKGSLTIHKFAQEKGDKQREGTGADGQTAVGEPLEGVTYKLIRTHKFDSKTDKWTEVGYRDRVTYEEVTGSDGKIVINNIPLGRYSVQEISGPSNVIIDKTKYYVDIPMTNKDGKSHNYNVHIYPKNELIHGAVELTKYDGEGKKHRGKYPTQSRVKFKLFNENDEQINGIYETDRNGKIQVDGLEYGNYYFVEVSARDSYVQHSGKFEFSITKYGKFTNKGSKGKVEKVDVTNYHKTGIEKRVNDSKRDLEINRNTEFTYNLKIDLPGDIHNYESFVITDTLHGNLSYGGSWNVSGADDSAFTFTENGQELKWTVTNFNKLKGKKNITINFTAKINGDAPADKKIPNKGLIDYENNTGTTGQEKSNKVNVIPTAGSITVIKTDDKKRNAKRLNGATFELYKDGEKVAEGTTSGYGNNRGTIKFENLDYGTYELKETKAPNGYRLLTKTIEVEVNKKNKHQKVTVENSENGWELPKTGGIGTTLFSFIGLTFMGAALFMFFRRRRMDA